MLKMSNDLQLTSTLSAESSEDEPKTTDIVKEEDEIFQTNIDYEDERGDKVLFNKNDSNNKEIDKSSIIGEGIKRTNKEAIDELMEKKFSDFLQSKTNRNNNVLKRNKQQSAKPDTVEKKNEDEPDELQLIYKGLTDPSFTGKKSSLSSSDKTDDNAKKVSTKNLIEVLEDESDIHVDVSRLNNSGDNVNKRRIREGNNLQRSDAEDGFNNKNKIRSINRPMNKLKNNDNNTKNNSVSNRFSNDDRNRSEINDKKNIQLKLPVVTLVKLEDRIKEFENEPYAESLKMHLKYFRTTKDKSIKEENFQSDEHYGESVVTPLLLGSIDYDPIPITNGTSLSIKTEEIANDKENQSLEQQQQQQPKRRGRKKGYKKVQIEEDYVTHDSGKKEPAVKFSMQTRKRRLKFLPDGSLVCNRYSPSSDRKTDTESSESGSDTDAELNSLLLIDEPPAKRKYVKKEPGEKRRPGRPRKKILPDDDPKLQLRSNEFQECIGIFPTTANVLSQLFNTNDINKSLIDVRSFKQDVSADSIKSPSDAASNVLIKRNNVEKPGKMGVITAIDKSGTMRFKCLNTNDKLKLIGYDNDNDFGTVVAKRKDKMVRYSVPKINVIRDSTSRTFGEIRMINKDVKKSSTDKNVRYNNHHHHHYHHHQNNNKNKIGNAKIKETAEIEELLLRNKKKTPIKDVYSSSNEDDYNDYNDHNNNDNNDLYHKKKRINNKILETDMTKKKTDSENDTNNNNNNNNTVDSRTTSIILNREYVKTKESRTVRTNRGPKKALQLAKDEEDESSFVYNISDADDTMLKLVTQDLQSISSPKTIYDVMEAVSIEMPSWNLHIIPESNSFCIAQVSRGRMGIPILKKTIELDKKFFARVYVHQLHCKRYDGVYADERSIVNLIKEIDSLSA